MPIYKLLLEELLTKDMLGEAKHMLIFDQHQIINWMLPLLQREELCNILTAALITSDRLLLMIRR